MSFRPWYLVHVVNAGMVVLASYLTFTASGRQLLTTRLEVAWLFIGWAIVATIIGTVQQRRRKRST
jgi:hypothetical protein